MYMLHTCLWLRLKLHQEWSFVGLRVGNWRAVLWAVCSTPCKSFCHVRCPGWESDQKSMGLQSRQQSPIAGVPRSCCGIRVAGSSFKHSFCSRGQGYHLQWQPGFYNWISYQSGAHLCDRHISFRRWEFRQQDAPRDASTLARGFRKLQTWSHRLDVEGNLGRAGCSCCEAYSNCERLQWLVDYGSVSGRWSINVWLRQLVWKQLQRPRPWLLGRRLAVEHRNSSYRSHRLCQRWAFLWRRQFTADSDALSRDLQM